MPNTIQFTRELKNGHYAHCAHYALFSATNEPCRIKITSEPKRSKILKNNNAYQNSCCQLEETNPFRIRYKYQQQSHSQVVVESFLIILNGSNLLLPAIRTFRCLS